MHPGFQEILESDQEVYTVVSDLAIQYRTSKDNYPSKRDAPYRLDELVAQKCQIATVLTKDGLNRPPTLESGNRTGPASHAPLAAASSTSSAPAVDSVVTRGDTTEGATTAVALAIAASTSTIAAADRRRPLDRDDQRHGDRSENEQVSWNYPGALFMVTKIGGSEVTCDPNEPSYVEGKDSDSPSLSVINDQGEEAADASRLAELERAQLCG